MPSITAAETNYLAFNIASVDYHIQLYGYLQAKTSTSAIKDCDSYIGKQPLYNHTYDKPSPKVPGTNETLCTYVRNAINHPDSGRSYTNEELRLSIEILRSLL